MVSATDGSFLSCMPRSTPMILTSSSARCSGSSGTRDSRMRRSRSGSGKSMCRNRHRRLSASDSSRVALEVSRTNGLRSAVMVPSSGTVTAKSDSTSSSRPSISMSALSVSSISSTVGSVRRIAVSSGRGQQEFLAEHVGFRLVPVAVPGLDPQDLLGVVPLVERAGLVDALVALQPHQARAGGLRDGARQLGLADAGGAFHQQWLAQPVGEEHRCGRCGVGQVAGFRQTSRDIVDVGEQRCRACGDAHMCSL